MVFGETGTGKEGLAQSIHNPIARKNRPYVVINGSAIPENLREGLLFGTSKSTITGAIDKAGLFEAASIQAALAATRGNAAGAARRLGISPQLMHYKLKRFGIDRLDFRQDASG
jgi:arginine utilization regulatory protein